MIASVHRILKFSGPFAGRIRAAYLFSLLKSICNNLPIMISVYIINSLMEGSFRMPHCIFLACLMVLVLVLGALFQNLADRFQSTAGYEVFAKKRMELGEHLRRLPMGFFSAGNMGRVSSILSADMVFIEENSMNVVADVVSDVFAQAILTAFIFSLHPLLGAVCLVTVSLAAIVGYFMQKSDLKNSRRRQQAIEGLTDSVIEYTEGQSVIKGYRIVGDSAAELRRDFREMTEANLDYEDRHMPWERLLLVIYALGMTAVLALALQLHSGGSLASGSLIGVLLLLFNLFSPIKHMYQLNTRISIMNISLDRLERIFAEKILPDEGKDILPESSNIDALELSTPEASADELVSVPEIEFRDVSFAYGSEKVLQHVSFSAQKGQMLALVGQSGSGKTTLANLLARFWDITEGQILIRGKDVRDIPMESLMSSISMVFQRVYLFGDTVFSNIAMGRPDVSREAVYEAAKKARCYDFIMQLPYGFDTVIGEGGSSLSGGEAQRISIARCLLKDAPIVVLDEATASIDADNERLIGEALSELCRGKTVIVIAHRLGTVQAADRIVVLDKGRVEAVGTHEELMKHCGLYRHLVALNDSSADWSRGRVSVDAAASEEKEACYD